MQCGLWWRYIRSLGGEDVNRDLTGAHGVAGGIGACSSSCCGPLCSRSFRCVGRSNVWAAVGAAQADYRYACAQPSPVHSHRQGPSAGGGSCLCRNQITHGLPFEILTPEPQAQGLPFFPAVSLCSGLFWSMLVGSSPSEDSWTHLTDVCGGPVTDTLIRDRKIAAFER